MNANRLRAVLGALFLSLTLAGPTLAVSTSGSTSETLTIASTISMTVPASVSYPGGKIVNTAPVSLSNIQTDNATGLTVLMTVNAAGSLKITPASRAMTGPVVTAGCQGSGAVTSHAAGYFVDGTTTATVVGDSGPNGSPCTSAWTASVDATTYLAGAFTGTLSFTATTNP